jgi:hypothetical protein
MSKRRLDLLPLFPGRTAFLWWGEEEMTDQQLALQAINEAQLILEEYLRPRPQNNEHILDKLVEVLERPDLVVAVSRLQQQSNLSVHKWGNCQQSPWPPGLLRSYQLGHQTRRPNNNAAPQRHQIRTGVGGPIVLSMDESAGMKASPCFRNRCWNGPRGHSRNPFPTEKKFKALSQRSPAIR